MNTFKKWYGKLEEKETPIQPDLFPKEFATKRTTIPGRQISSRSTEVSKLPNINSRGRMISSVKQSLENFWKWFGDSEAVDAKGRPLVFFHGTVRDFESFKSGLKTHNTSNFGGAIETKRAGIFVTSEPKFAELYTHKKRAEDEAPNIMTVYAKAENPADLRSFRSIERQVPGIEGKTAEWFDRLPATWMAFDDEEGEEFVSELKNLGYDSARILEEDGSGGEVEVWVLFESNQLKAVYGNVGTYSNISNRIAESKEDTAISEAFQLLFETKASLLENVFRVGSESYFKLFEYARNHCDELSASDRKLVEETDIGRFGLYEGKQVPLDCPMIEEDVIAEAEYKGKNVDLNSPKRNSGSGKKYVVYTKNKNGNVIKVTFGDEKGGLTSKINDPKARKAFADRHQCHLKTDKTTPGYWACRLPMHAKSLGLSGGGNFFW